MSEEYTVIHQWDKVRNDFEKLMGDPYVYIEGELKRISKIFDGGNNTEIGIAFLDFKSVVDMLEKLNTIFTPKLKRK